MGVDVLLDTHVWLWMHQNPDRLSTSTRDLLTDIDNNLHLSVASIWETGIKYATGKLALHIPPEQYVVQRTDDMQILPILSQHVLFASNLPMHHRDPFDRILIAQAQLENLSLLTVDSKLASYSAKIIWADQ